MFKKISQSILELNPEKAFNKHLDDIDFSSIEQRQKVIDLLIQYPDTLIVTQQFKELSDVVTLCEIILLSDGRLKNETRQMLHGLLLEKNLDPNESFYLSLKGLIDKLIGKEKLETIITQEKNALTKNQIIFLLANFCENNVLCETLLNALSSEQHKTILVESNNQYAKEIILKNINTLDTLKELEKITKVKNKKSHKLVQNKIETIETLQKQKQTLIEEAKNIIEAINKLSNTAVAPLYESKLQHLEQEWSSLPNKISQSPFSLEEILSKDFDNVFNEFAKNCHKKINEIKEQELSDLKKDQTITFLKSALSKLKAFISAETIDIDACNGLVESIDNKIKSVDAGDIPNSFNQKIYQYYFDILNFEINFSKQESFFKSELELQLNTLNTLFDSNHKKKKAADETLTQISEMYTSYKNLLSDYPQCTIKNENLESSRYRKINGVIANINKLLQKSKSMQLEFQSKFDKKTGYIKSEIENKALGTVTRLCKESEELIPYCPVENREKLVKRLEKHKEEKKSLEDWFNFATLPKRKELCESMEELSKNASNMKIGTLKEAIHNLQQQWKELGYARDKEGEKLWKKFQELGNTAYQPVKNLVERKEKEKENNLSTRKKIIEQLSLVISLENKIEHDLEKLLRRSQSQWKRAFPIPSGNQTLQTEFDKLIDALNKKLQPQRKINLGKKKALLADAKKLENIEDNSIAIKEAKSLQHLWKEIGFCDEDDSLWESFREICDKIFNLRDELRNQEKSKEKDAVNQAKAICLSIESINHDNVHDFEGELRKLNNQFNELKDQLAKRKDLQGHFKSANKLAKKNLSLLKKEKERKSFDDLIILSEKLGSIENTLIKGELAPEALQENIDSVISDSTLNENIVIQLKNNIESLASKNSAEKQIYIEQQKAKLRELCISLEIELKMESPSSDKALRMQLQVERLNKRFNKADEELSYSEKIVSAFCFGGIHSYQPSNSLKRLIALNNKVD